MLYIKCWSRRVFDLLVATRLSLEVEDDGLRSTNLFIASQFADESSSTVMIGSSRWSIGLWSLLSLSNFLSFLLLFVSKLAVPYRVMARQIFLSLTLLSQSLMSMLHFFMLALKKLCQPPLKLGEKYLVWQTFIFHLNT